MSATLPLCSRCAQLYHYRLGAASLRASPQRLSELSSRQVLPRFWDHSTARIARPFSSSQTGRQSKRPLVTSAASVQQKPSLETTPPPPRNAGATAVPGMNDLRLPDVDGEQQRSGAQGLGSAASENAFGAKVEKQEMSGQMKEGGSSAELQRMQTSTPDSSTASPSTVASSTAASSTTASSTTASSATASSATASSKPRPKLKPLRAAVKLTPSAVTHIQALLDQPSPKLLRVGTRRRGCSGLAYHLEYVDKADKFDEVVRQDGVEILVESRALLTVLGTTMDWVDEKLGSRFVFNNPNIKEQCGCGESFMV